MQAPILWTDSHGDLKQAVKTEVKPINHTYTIEQMVHLGHDLEAQALSHAVKMHVEQRICLNGDKTVILR